MLSNLKMLSPNCVQFSVPCLRTKFQDRKEKFVEEFCLVLSVNTPGLPYCFQSVNFWWSENEKFVNIICKYTRVVIVLS